MLFDVNIFLIIFMLITRSISACACENASSSYYLVLLAIGFCSLASHSTYSCLSGKSAEDGHLVGVDLRGFESAKELGITSCEWNSYHCGSIQTVCRASDGRLLKFYVPRWTPWLAFQLLHCIGYLWTIPDILFKCKSWGSVVVWQIPEVCDYSERSPNRSKLRGTVTTWHFPADDECPVNQAFPSKVTEHNSKDQMKNKLIESLEQK